VNIKEKKLEKSRVELSVEIPPERIAEEYERVFVKIQKQARVDGFRVGKAPMAMVKTRYKDNADQQVVEDVIKSTYLEAVKEKDLHPISYPAFDIPDRLEAGKPFSFKATFDVPPTVELGTYNSISAEERQVNVNELDVLEYIDSLREQKAVLSKKDETLPAEKGDVVKLKVTRIDNVAPEAIAKADARDVSVIAGTRDDKFEFDAYVIGMKTGEEKDVTFEYPKDYQYKSVAGTTQVFRIKADEIQKRDIPELDDEFAKDLEYADLNEMKTKIRADIDTYVSQKCRGEAKAHILTKIVENSKFEIPQSMIDQEKEEVFSRLCQKIGFRAESPEQIAPFFGMKAEDINKRMLEDAEQTIKTTLSVNEIARKESLVATEEKYAAAVADIAKRMNKDSAEVTELIEKNEGRRRLESEIIYNDTVDFVYAQAKIKKLSAVSYKEFSGKEEQ
jgi:trigger factor